METYILDASKFTDKDSSHAYLKEILNFPDYYGNNLDALSDCLSEIKDLHLVITNLENKGDYFLTVYPVLHDEGRAIIV